MYAVNVGQLTVKMSVVLSGRIFLDYVNIVQIIIHQRRIVMSKECSNKKKCCSKKTCQLKKDAKPEETKTNWLLNSIKKLFGS